MANTLQNFIVGIGLDTKDFKKGSKEVDSDLNLIKSRVLLTSAAIAGAFGLAFAAANTAADRIDGIALASSHLSTSAKFVNDYGNALRLLGGDAGDALSALTSVEDALVDFQKRGKFSAFEDPALAGVNTQALSQAKNGEEFLRMLSDMTKGMDTQQLRMIQTNFGFSNQVMDSLRNGSKYFDEIVANAERLAPGFEKSVEAARELNSQYTALQLRMEGLGNSFAEKVLDPLSKFIGSVNNLIDKHGWRLPLAAEFSLDVAQRTPLGVIINAPQLVNSASGTVEKYIGGGNIGNTLSSAAIAVGLDEKNVEKARRIKPNSLGNKINQWGMDVRGGMLDKGRINPYALDVMPYSFPNFGLPQQKMQPQEITVNSTLNLDGRVIDERITKVQVLRDKSTLEDLKTTTAR